MPSDAESSSSLARMAGVATPATFGSGPPVAHSDHLVGALAVTVAMIALADVGRTVRFVNPLFGAWLIAAAWLLGGATAASAWNDVVAGVTLILLSLRQGPVGEQFGGWQPWIR